MFSIDEKTQNNNNKKMGWWVLLRCGTTCQQQALPRLISYTEDIRNYGISKKIEQMFHVRAMMFSEHLPISQCL